MPFLGPVSVFLGHHVISAGDMLKYPVRSALQFFKVFILWSTRRWWSENELGMEAEPHFERPRPDLKDSRRLISQNRLQVIWNLVVALNHNICIISFSSA